MTAVAATARRRVRARVEGTVQGVGFRPYVFRLASELGVSGHVFNDERGVVIEAEAAPRAVDALLARLAVEAPPLASVERVSVEDVPAVGEERFEIVESPSGGEPGALVSPDAATCEDCLREMLDPADRRHRYPFTNCTNCGPRFTIVRGVPYDRPLTTMAGFEMCGACRAEYDDPADRRFHAQPNACPACGPRARLVDADGADVGGRDPVAAAGRALLGGAIVAVKGIGGYHLACRADDEAAVSALRSRKHREEKPFALMVADAGAARRLVTLGPEEERLLGSRERPIVLCPRLADAPVAASVAPTSPELGVMLPYSPLHHLLIADAGVPLVLTSGNLSDEPIAYVDGEAMARLAGIADRFLVHDRPIETRTDDSVTRVVRGRPLMLRRSRGFVPRSVGLPLDCPEQMLGCGAELKNTFCVAKGARAWVGHHIGDLENYETLRSFTEGIEHLSRLFAVEPAVVAHDLHPEYLSTKHAADLDGVRLVGVQHHHAHLAACLAEHGETGPAAGAIFDGTGLGEDGTVWGGEILLGGLARSERAAHLLQVPLPGGEMAVRQPWRMACSWLASAGGSPAPSAALAARVDARRWEQVAALAASGLNSPLTSSMGRLFDAVAALCGLRHEVTYEGQAAIELEAVCDPGERGAYEIPLDGPLLDARPAVLAVREDADAGVETGVISARFHNAVARAAVEACAATGAATVVLSGGVFQNRVLLERTAGLAEDRGLRVLVPERLPPNDGGISYGQVAAALARMAEGFA